MSEGWLAFAVALMSERFLLPEGCFAQLVHGPLRKTYITDQDKADMVIMHETMYYAEIADIYGVNKATVCRIVKSLTDKVKS